MCAHCPETRVIMLTAHHEDVWVRGLLDLGAAGYVLKDDALDAVTRAVRAIAAGGTWLSPAVQHALLHHAAGPEALTPRERTVLALIAEGLSNKEIAAELHLGEQTVSNYLSTLYAKLGVTSRMAAVAQARESGLA